MAGLHVEEHGHLAAEAEVLRRGADLEADRRLPLPGLGAVEQGQGVLDPQAAEVLRHGRARDHLGLEEAAGGPARDLSLLQVPLVLPRHAQVGRPGDDRARLRARDPQGPGGPGLVEHLDEDRRVAALLEDRRRRPAADLDPLLGVDADHEQHVRVEEPLDRRGVPLPDGLRQAGDRVVRQGCPEGLQGPDRPDRRWPPAADPPPRPARGPSRRRDRQAPGTLSPGGTGRRSTRSSCDVFRS